MGAKRSADSTAATTGEPSPTAPKKAASLIRAARLEVHRTSRDALASLGERLLARAKAKPLQSSTLLVDSHAVGRNVIASLAMANGTAVGVEAVHVCSFLRDVVEATIDTSGVPLPARQQTLTHHSIGLAISSILPDLQKHGSPASKEIANAIAKEKTIDLSKHLALCAELARSYDHARQTHLPSAFCNLEPWVADVHAALERHAAAALAKDADDRLLRYLHEWEAAITALEQLGGDDTKLRTALHAAGVLPDTLFVFDLTVEANSPLAEALALLSRIVQLECFVIDPVQQSPSDPASRGWADRSRAPIASTLKAFGHDTFADTPLCFEGDHSLRRVQKSLAGDVLPAAAHARDDSLQVHYVAAEARAAEVVRDVVHKSFADFQGLLPEDILVVSDDPRRDIPFIQSAFSSSDDSQTIPFVSTGVNTRDKNVAIDAFLAALRLAPTSFARDAVFRVIAMPPVTEGLGLESDDVESLEKACRQAGLRAYIDKAQRLESIKVPGQTDHCTWAAALASLAASMALPEGGHAVVTDSGITPAGALDATDMHLIAALSQVNTVLSKLRLLSKDAPLTEKLLAADEVAKILFGDSFRGKSWQQTIAAATNAIATDAKSVGFLGTVDFFWFSGELGRRLNRVDSATCPMYGGVSMVTPAQARARTPRVAVFLLSERFPTRDRPLWPEPYGPKTVLLQQQQHDLRDVFTVVMSTVDRAIFIVPSMCHRTGERLSMSSIVHDLKAIAESLSPHGVSLFERESTVVSHALSTIMPPAETRHQGSRKGALAILKVRSKGYKPNMFAVPDLLFEVPTEVKLDDFLRFFEKPIETYLRHHKLFVEDVEDNWQFRESMEPNSLEKWRVRDAVFQACEQRRGPVGPSDLQPQRAIITRLRACGVLRDDGAAMDEVFDRSQTPHQCSDDLLKTVQIHSAWSRVASGKPIIVDKDVAYTIKDSAGAPVGHRLRIHGEIFTDVTPSGVVEIIRHGIKSFKASDVLASAVLQTLYAECSTPQLTTAIRNMYLSENPDVSAFRGRLISLGGEPPYFSLAQLARIWHIGLQMPIPLFADSLMKSLPSGAAREPVNLFDARKKFLAADVGRGAGVGHDAKVISVFRGLDAIYDSLFRCNEPDGSPASDFRHLAEFFARARSDAFPMV